MKIRQGFVSNSSSSSFIAVFAKVPDDPANMSELDKHFDRLKTNPTFLLYIKSGKELIDMSDFDYSYGWDGDWAGVDTAPKKKDLDPEAKYIIFQSNGGAGDDDSDFLPDDEDGDFDYDVELSDFRTFEQEIYSHITEENGFTKIKKGYGAGRNG